ncbi:MAG: hypothetical protein KGD72_02025, partial [Candidatus Lokiarchaeota archaeon]|nr:hypothetical protein [Candidatus Lokiarchaeota archaeon]
MKFCPNCEKVLFPTNNQLYCKTCSLFYVLKKGKLVAKNDNDLLNEINLSGTDDNKSEAEYKKKSNKDTSNLNHQKTSYRTFFPYEDYRTSQE